jgi:hypothetical protein
MRLNVKFLNQKGMSLLSTVGAAAILGAGSVVVFKMLDQSEKASSSITKELAAVDLGKYLTTQTKKVFLDTKGPDGRNVMGMCDFIFPKSCAAEFEQTRLVDLGYDIKDATKEALFDNSRWKQYFEGFDIVKSNDECIPENKYGVCLDLNEGYKSNTLAFDPGILKSHNVKVKVDINLIQTNPLSEKPFSKVVDYKKAEQWDIKSVGYEYTITTYYNNRKDIVKDKSGQNIATFTRKSSVLKGFIWAGELNICHKGLSKIAVVGTGYGDTSPSFKYASAGFLKEQNQEKSLSQPINIQEKYVNAQSGKTVGSLGKQKVTTDDSTLLFSSCNERTYQCPQKPNVDLARDYDRMKVNLDVTYDKGAILPYYSKARCGDAPVTMNIAPSISIINEDGVSGIQDSVFKADYNYAGKMYSAATNKKRQQRFYQENSNGNIPSEIKNRVELELKDNSELNLQIDLFDKNRSSRLNSVCRQVCSPKNNYNKKRGGKFFLNMKNKIFLTNSPKGLPGLYERKSNDPIACTSCHMKNCDRYGLGTFGALDETPTEPLDSRVPECVMHETMVMADKSELEGGVKNLGSSNANKCIAYKLKRNSGDEFKYMAEDCSKDLRVMCFNFGKHFLARETSAASLDVVKGSFNSANEICFQTGREIVEKESIQELFAQQGNGTSPSSVNFLNSDSSDFINFVNLSQQGTFLHPIGANQKKMLKEFSLTKRGESLTNKYFWVNLKTDSDGFVYAPAPQISGGAKEAKNKWGLAFSSAGTMYVNELASNIDIPSGNAAVLHNDIRFQGINFVNPEAPYGLNGKLRFLCMVGGVVKVSNERGENQSLGKQICKNMGGDFVPPVTTAMWIKALHLTHPLQANSTLPTSRFNSVTKHDPVWVAIKGSRTNSSVYSIYDNTLLTEAKSGLIHADGKYFQAPPVPVVTDPPTPAPVEKVYSHLEFCIDDNEGIIETKDSGSCDNGFRNMKHSDITRINSSNHRLLKIELIKALNNVSDNELLKLED